MGIIAYLLWTSLALGAFTPDEQVRANADAKCREDLALCERKVAAIISFQLWELGWAEKPATPRGLTKDTRAMYAEFAKAMGAEASNAFEILKTLGEATARVEKFDRTSKTRLPEYKFLDEDPWIKASGAFQFLRGSNDSIVPLQTDEIYCSKITMKCTRTFVYLTPVDDVHFLNVQNEEFDIKDWGKKIVTTKPRGICSRFHLTLDRASKTVTLHKSTEDKEACKGFEKDDKSFKLVDSREAINRWLEQEYSTVERLSPRIKSTKKFYVDSEVWR